MGIATQALGGLLDADLLDLSHSILRYWEHCRPHHSSKLSRGIVPNIVEFGAIR